MTFTYIIPFKYTPDRFLTLKKVIDNIKKLNTEIIIIEQGTESFLPDNYNMDNIKYIFLNNPHPFNKSWSLNIAYKESSNDIIVFGDADNLIDTDNLILAINQMEDYEFISPHKRLIDLSENENNLEYSDIFNINRPGRGELDHQKLPMCGAMTIFKKSSLDKIGGWPEEFFGWGAEDDAMSIKVKHFLKWKEIDEFNCYHLYHQPAIPDMAWYKRNITIYQQYMNTTKEGLQDYINKTSPIIGDKNRKFS